MGSVTLFLTTVVVATLQVAHGDSQRILCPPNEEWRCVGSCPPEKTCKDRYKVVGCAVNHRCRQSKCYCQTGYYRDNNRCISERECEKKYPRCPRNEEYVKCKSTCPGDSCASIWIKTYKCPAHPPCRPGCQCKTGYKRLNMKCIPVKQCPKRDTN